MVRKNDFTNHVNSSVKSNHDLEIIQPLVKKCLDFIKWRTVTFLITLQICEVFNNGNNHNYALSRIRSTVPLWRAR